ncbi:MAG: hypothetical protein IPQ05_03195 [Leptospiraceae bacterium]|nr:hypothetical protein [Leptospiraceae bacterium]MBL0262885.1 hypothetical protein [Leptospiraceae bacterium]
MKKIFYTFLFFVLIVAGIYCAAYFYISSKASALPINSPILCKNHPNSKLPRMVAIGDSITHGRVSFNYVNSLEEKFGTHYEFVNAGINSNLAFNVLNRIQDIIDCNPEKISILIGTNDVNSTLDEARRNRYKKDMQLPQDPDKAWYEKNLRLIIATLKEKTKAEIAILSLPVIGEILTSEENRKAKEYSDSIKTIASELGITYLPLNEKMHSYLLEKKNLVNICSGDFNLYNGAFIKFFLLSESWDQVSQENGFYLVTDCLHLNAVGARMISDLIGEFLEKGNRL